MGSEMCIRDSDKVVGRNFSLFDDLAEQDKQGLRINLVTIGTKNGKELESVDAWNTQEDSEEWGKDNTYQP